MNGRLHLHDRDPSGESDRSHSTFTPNPNVARNKTYRSTVGFTVVGTGGAEDRVYVLDGAQIPFASLIDYLKEGVYYKDAQGYHYVQEEGAINPTTGKPALVTKPPTTTTTTTTDSTTTTGSTSTAGTSTTTTTIGTTTTTTLGTDPAPP